jgi:WD40-like Beta Propeller Repeat
MKRLFGIFLFSAAINMATNGSVTGILVQNSDTLNINKLLKVDKFGLKILPPSSGVQFYRDGIVFLFQTKSEAKMLESHTSFGATEAYYGVQKDTSVSNHILFSPSFSWAVPCEAMTFNSDYSIMYYTKRPSNKEPEKIFQARYQQAKNGKHEWISESKPLSFCTDKSIYSHPALSADGEKMVFTSNKSESIGGLDLFISYKEASGWSSPINLGNLINTRGNELSPYLDQDNNLFFSSDGIEGFGGYDIYICRYNGRGWEKPANLTKIINTQDDELAFTLSRLDRKSAFYTTRYKTGNRLPQLFKVVLQDQYALKKLTNLSNAFKYIAQAGLIPAEEEIPAKTEPLPEIKPEVKLPAEKAAETRNEIIYRIQFLSNSKPKGSYNITIGGRTYKTFEYLSNGLYKSCVGEYTSPAQANNLLAIMKKEGYPDAFVAAFENNERVANIPSTAISQELTIQKPVAEPAQTQKLPEVKKQEPIKPAIEQAAPLTDNIVFRVQFSSNMKSKGSYEITIGGKKYKTFEYLYNGAYRSCAGEFNTSASAAGLQKQLKQEGYPDAFVIATKGKVRVTDPALFKR